MKNNKALLTFILASTLFSCVPNNSEGSSFALSQSQSTIPLSSATTTSEQSSESRSSPETSLSSERSSPETSHSSLASSSVSSRSSESSSLNSLDPEDCFAVSIYQYYKEADYMHKQGEIRLDLVIQVEKGQPLYSTTDEHRAIKNRLSPDYFPRGDGYWYTVSFFCDQECTTFYLSGTPILSDSSLYYYCGG